VTALFRNELKVGGDCSPFTTFVLLGSTLFFVRVQATSELHSAARLPELTPCVLSLVVPFSLLCGIWSIFSDRAIDYEEEEGDFPEISTDALVKVGMSGVGILRFRKDRILMSSQAVSHNGRSFLSYAELIFLLYCLVVGRERRRFILGCFLKDICLRQFPV
jgi:hypothetical protein